VTRYVIVGNSAGGVGAAEAIRQVDRNGSLTMISEEPYPAYSRPLIARYLSRETPEERMAYRPAGFYQALGIDLVLGTALEGIDTAARTVRLGGGRVLPWDRLLLAVGGTPIVPPAEGLAEHEYFTFTTLDDAKRLAAHVSAGSRAVVVGGGLIGISVAEALVKLGVAVTIVELAPQVLGRALDARAGAMARCAIERAGVQVYTGRTVARVVGRESGKRAVAGVVLDDGVEIACDTLVVAVGVRPRVEVVAGTDIAVGRGIIVDRHMATSVPEVYACGDVAEAYDFVLGANRLTPIWPNAYLGGRIAGRNMAGAEMVYDGGTAMNSLHSFGLSIMSAGTVDPPADDAAYEVLSCEDAGRGIYKKIVLREGRVVGMIFCGAIDRAGIVFGLMRSGVSVKGFKERLLADDLGLLSLPADLRREWMQR